MSYITNLKKNSNIGKLAYRHLYGYHLLLTLLTICFIALGTLTAYVFFADVGYTDFTNNMPVRTPSKVCFNQLYTIASAPETGETYCLYVYNDQSGIILVKDTVLNTKLNTVLEKTANNELSDPVVIKGISLSYNSSFIDFVSSDKLLSAFKDSFGTVFLYTAVDTHPTCFIPMMRGLLIIAALIFFIDLFIITKDAKVVAALKKIDSEQRFDFDDIDSELGSQYNLSLNNNILLTENLFFNSKKPELFCINTIMWLYMQVYYKNGKPMKKALYAHTSDGSKHMLVSEKCINGFCSADVLYEYLSKHDIPLIGYSKDIKAQYKRMVSDR